MCLCLFLQSCPVKVNFFLKYRKFILFYGMHQNVFISFFVTHVWRKIRFQLFLEQNKKLHIWHVKYAKRIQLKDRFFSFSVVNRFVTQASEIVHKRSELFGSRMVAALKVAQKWHLLHLEPICSSHSTATWCRMDMNVNVISKKRVAK